VANTKYQKTTKPQKEQNNVYEANQYQTFIWINKKQESKIVITKKALPIFVKI